VALLLSALETAVAARLLAHAPVRALGVSRLAHIPEDGTRMNLAIQHPIEAHGLAALVVPAGQHETRIVPLRVHLPAESTAIPALEDARLAMSAEDMAAAVGPGLAHTLSAPADLVVDRTLVPVHGRAPFLILLIRDIAGVEVVRVHLVGQGGVTVAMILGTAGQGHQKISVTNIMKLCSEGVCNVKCGGIPRKKKKVCESCRYQSITNHYS